MNEWVGFFIVIYIAVSRNQDPQHDVAYTNFLFWCKLKNKEESFSEPVSLPYVEEKLNAWN